MRSALTILCLSLFTALVIAQNEQMPQQFRGSWAGRRAQCGRASESSLTVYADRVIFYESEGPIRGVKRIGDREVEVEAELSGEGEVRRETLRFRLSNNGRTLTVLRTEPPYSGFARIRCGQAAHPPTR